MSVKEALGWIRLIKKLTDEKRYYTVSVWAEDMEELLTSRKVRVTKEMLEQHCRRFMPPGKYGHMTLVLRDPYDARALATLCAVVRSIKLDDAVVEAEPEVVAAPPTPPPVKVIQRPAPKPKKAPEPVPVAPVTSVELASEETEVSGEALALLALQGALD